MGKKYIVRLTERPSSRWHLAGTQLLGEIPNSWRAGDLVAKSGVAAGSAARAA